MQILFGHNVHEMATARKYAAREGISDGRERDNALCREQIKLHSEGIRGAEIVKSVYGWHVRSDTGMENFRILAGQNILDGSYENAVQWSEEWQMEDSSRRYVWVR